MLGHLSKNNTNLATSGRWW